MINKLLKILFVITLIILIISFNFKILSLNLDFYKKEFTKLNIYEKIPDADKNALNLINYYKDKEELNNFYNEKEKSHLKDVKLLIKKLFFIFYLSLILLVLLLIYFIYNKRYKTVINLSLISSSTLIILILILNFINFDNFFYNFHLFFFNNDLWQLNPEKDNLVNLFPQEFFYDIFAKALINILIISVILLIIAIILKSSKKFLNNNV